MKYNDILKNVKMKYDMLYICILNFQTLSKKIFFDWILNSYFDEFIFWWIHILIFRSEILGWLIFFSKFLKNDFLDEKIWKMIFLTKKFEISIFLENWKFSFFLEKWNFVAKRVFSSRKGVRWWMMGMWWLEGWYLWSKWKYLMIMEWNGLISWNLDWVVGDEKQVKIWGLGIRW